MTFVYRLFVFQYSNSHFHFRLTAKQKYREIIRSTGIGAIMRIFNTINGIEIPKKSNDVRSKRFRAANPGTGAYSNKK